MDTQPDLILRPSKKGKKPTMPYYNGKLRIVAEVMGLASYQGSAYQHPVVKLGCLDVEGDRIVSYPRGVSVEFQRGSTVGADRRDYDAAQRGFLGDGRCGRSYAGEIQVRLDDVSEQGSRWLALVERAMAKGRSNKIGCDLLRLVVGLRKLGIEVRIYNPAIRARHDRRDGQRAREAA